MSRNLLRTRRARATLAWGLAWFLAAQVGFRVALQFHPKLVDIEFGRKLADIRRMQAAAPGRPLILMFGSSRVATGFRPGVLPGRETPGSRAPIVYNFAQVGSGPEMAHLSLRRLLAAGVRPDWVFLEYWPPFWTKDRTPIEFHQQINLGCLGWSDIRLLGSYLPADKRRRLYRNWYPTQLDPLSSNRTRPLANAAPGWLLPPAPVDSRAENLDPLGWWSPTASVTPDERRRREDWNRHHYEPRLREFHTREAPDRALRAMLEICRRERIRSTIVWLPEGQDFRRIYPTAALDEVRDYLDRLGREFGVATVDARTWVADDGFMDGHHLLPSGAEIFTRRFGTEVLQPALAGTASPLRR